jgi:hypothetical protein
MTGPELRQILAQWAAEAAALGVESTPAIDLAQSLLCTQPLDVLGGLLVLADKLKKSGRPDDRVTGELLEAQTLFAMSPKWDGYRR